jgi:hypothetical protein
MHMPIRLLLKNDHSFGPELNLTKREDPATLLVAKIMLEAAKEGERDPTKLRERAVRAFRKD